MRLRRLLPVSLRLSTLGLRFVLIFLLARYLPISDVGLYGLFTAAVSYVLYPLGFDFYTYSTRQIMRGDRGRWRTFVSSQMAFACLMFAILAPLLVLLFALGFLPWSLIIWFYILVPLEYVGLELDRLLIAMLDQAGASVVLFVGGALNPLTAIPLLALAPSTRHLSTVLATWTAYDALALVIGAALFLRHTRGTRTSRVDWQWIRVGMRAALPFLGGTLCLRALFTVDRGFVRAFGSLSTLGAYTFYISIGAGLTSVLYAGVQQFTYPQIIKAVHERDRTQFQHAVRSMLTQSAAVIVVIGVVAIAAEPLLLRFVGNDTYRHFAWLLPVVLGVIGVYNLSLVPHYALYALDADRVILKATIGSLAAFILVAATIAPINAVVGTILGIFAASSVLLIVKAVAAVRLFRAARATWA